MVYTANQGKFLYVSKLEIQSTLCVIFIVVAHFVVIIIFLSPTENKELIIHFLLF